MNRYFMDHRGVVHTLFADNTSSYSQNCRYGTNGNYVIIYFDEYDIEGNIHNTYESSYLSYNSLTELANDIENISESEEYYCLVSKSTNKPVLYETTPTNSTNCCGEYQTDLYTEDKWNEGLEIWKAKSINHALWVIHNSTEWYNADYEKPGHELEPNDIRIVKRKVSVNVIEENITMPDYKQMVIDIVGEDNYRNELAYPNIDYYQWNNK